MTFTVNNSGPNGGPIRLVVTPRDSSPLPEIEDNIQANLELFPRWVEVDPEKRNARPNETAWLIGGGPSLTDAFASGFITQDMFRGGSERNGETHSLWLCKHALPYFRSWTVPLNVIALDPRPIDGISTHDKRRIDLYESAPVGTVFYLASMTNPSVTKFLMDRGYDVCGWHATSNALAKFNTETKRIIEKNFHEIVQTGAISITGGTSSLLRAVGLCKEAFGISRFRLLGLDSSLRLSALEKQAASDPDSVWRTERDEITGSIKRMEVAYGVGNKPLWSTGELVAQAQDLDSMLKSAKQFGVDIKIVGTDKASSLAGQLWDRFQDL